MHDPHYGGHAYTLVRADLPGPQQAVQAWHAGVEASRQGLIPTTGAHPHLVLLTVPDEPALLLALQRLQRHHIPHLAFREPDQQQALTALCTAPLYSSRHRKVFYPYPMLGGTHAHPG